MRNKCLPLSTFCTFQNPTGNWTHSVAMRNLFEFSPGIYLWSRQTDLAVFWTEPAPRWLSSIYKVELFLISLRSQPQNSPSQLPHRHFLAWKITNSADNVSTSQNIRFSLKHLTEERLPHPKEFKLSNYKFLLRHLLLQDHFSTKFDDKSQMCTF